MTSPVVELRIIEARRDHWALVMRTAFGSPEYEAAMQHAPDRFTGDCLDCSVEWPCSDSMAQIENTVLGSS